MKDIKLIECIVKSYSYENKNKIDANKLEEILKDSLNIDIDSVIFDNNIIEINYNKIKKVLFEIKNDKFRLKIIKNAKNK